MMRFSLAIGPDHSSELMNSEMNFKSHKIWTSNLHVEFFLIVSKMGTLERAGLVLCAVIVEWILEEEQVMT